MRSSLVFVEFLLLAATASFFGPDGRLRAQSVAAEQDLLLGSWQLDLVKSRYTPGPPPRSEVRTYVRDNEGMKGTIRRRREDGREEVIEYRADFDREYPVMGIRPTTRSVSNESTRARRRPSSHTRGVCLEQRAARSPRMAGLLRSRSVKRTREFSRATSPSTGNSRAASSSSMI